MSFVYGGLQTEPSVPTLFFSVKVEIMELVLNRTGSPRGVGGRKHWPFYPVIFRRSDSDLIVARIGVPVVPGMILDDSNVFDVLEYLIWNFGESKKGNGISPNDLFLSLPFKLKGDMVESEYVVGLRRAVGCRHFLFETDGAKVHITVNGASQYDILETHSIPNVLFIKNDMANRLTWMAWVDTVGFKLDTDDGTPVGRDNVRKQIYHIPFTFTPSPKQVSKLQITSAKKFVEDHEVFSGNVGQYDPLRLIKYVHEHFWYLKSSDGKVIITLMDNVAFGAMDSVYAKIDQVEDKKDKERYMSRWATMMKRSLQDNTGRSRDKQIVMEAITILSSIQDDENRKRVD